MSVAPEIIDGFVRARAQRPAWPGLAPELRPHDIEEGYRVQKAVYDRLAAEGVARVGYKVGATSAGGQRNFGITEPVYAGIFAISRLARLADALTAGYIAPSAECEVAVTLGVDIDGARPGLTPADMKAAIDTCHLGCELIDNRYGDAMALGVPTLVADDFFNAGFVLGPANPNWRNLDLTDLHAAITINDQVFKGHTSSILDPFASLLWLAGKLAQHGQTLHAGDIVFTGTLVPPTKIPFPTTAFSLSIAGFEPMDMRN